MRRIGILCEVMSPPFDEGVRIVASRLARALSGQMEVVLLGSEDAQVDGLEVQGVLTDRYFMGSRLARALSRLMPQGLLYVPWTSLTARTLFRVGVLRRRAPGIPIGVLALQPRGAGRLSRILARFGRPDRLFALGPEVERDGLALDISVCRLKGGVDTDRFRPRGGEPLGDLRRSLGLPVDPWLVLHVGHLKESRGVMALASVQAVEGVQTLLMASSSTDQEPGIRKRLQESGVRVFDQYAENIQEYYRAADCYLFPVDSSVDSIELPLSVLEAMACNLPLVTTRFGGLPALLEAAGPEVAFVDAPEEIPGRVMTLRRDRPRARLRERVSHLTWDEMAREVVAGLEPAARRTGS